MAQPAPRCQVVMREMTNRVLSMVAAEMDKPEMKETVRTKLLTPLLQMIYDEVAPYLYGLVITIFLILVFSLMTFILFALSFLPKKVRTT